MRFGGAYSGDKAQLLDFSTASQRFAQSGALSTERKAMYERLYWACTPESFSTLAKIYVQGGRIQRVLGYWNFSPTFFTYMHTSWPSPRLTDSTATYE